MSKDKHKTNELYERLTKLSKVLDYMRMLLVEKQLHLTYLNNDIVILCLTVIRLKLFYYSDRTDNEIVAISSCIYRKILPTTSIICRRISK